MPNDLAALTRAYLAAIERGDGAAVMAAYHPGAEQIEYPNRLIANGMTRGVADMKAAWERGQTSVTNQRYEIVRLVVQGDEVAAEMAWTATVNVPLGTLKPGDTMRAHIASFISFRDGLILSQRSYDCFDPF
jgi:ketosteroid isomerase-like protein